MNINISRNGYVIIDLDANKYLTQVNQSVYFLQSESPVICINNRSNF